MPATSSAPSHKCTVVTDGKLHNDDDNSGNNDNSNDDKNSHRNSREVIVIIMTMAIMCNDSTHGATILDSVGGPPTL